MLRRKTLQGDSKIERVELRLRSALHGLIHELLQAQISTSLTYKLPLLIEAIQFFWYCIHSRFDFLWSANVASWLRSAVEYFQVDTVLREGNKSVFLILFYVFFTIQLVMFLLMIGTAFALVRSKRKTSTVLTYSLKTLSVYGLVINNILILPSFQMFITTLICYSNDPVNRGLECYSGFYFFHFAVAIIGFIISFVVSLMFTLLYIELNPYSKIPFAAPQSKINLGKLLLKLIIVLYISLDYTFSIDKGFIAVYGIIWIAILVFRYRSTPPYDRSVFRFSVGLDSIILWAAIIANVHAFIDTGGADNVGLVFLFLGSPFAAYAAITIIERRAVGYRKIIVKNLNKDTDVEMYLNTIFRLIENRDKPAQRMILEGVLRYHTRHCTKKESDCACYSLSKDYMKEEEAPEKLWYIWIKGIIVDVLEKFPKSARLHILYAYIQREKLNNKYKALFEMMIAKDNKPNVEQEFSIFRYKSLIEEEIIEEDSRTSETKGIDVNVIVHFQNSFVTFQAALENSVDLHLEFWRELLETNPGIYKLQSLGSMITHSVEEIGERYKKLNEINPNHIKMLQSYGNFLKNIVNDDVEGQRVLEKAEYVIKSAQVNKQFIENDRLKYGENSNTCIITVSGNFNKMGTIKNVNNEITRILGFSKADIIGQNVNRIIPKYLAELHDTLMRRYFETSETKIIGQERVVFPLSKKGYVVPCTLMIKILPNLDNGVRLVGFLNEVEGENNLAKVNDFEAEEKVHYVVYSGDTGAIHGYTQSCRKEFGLPSSLIYGAAATNDFTMDVIFPDLLNHNIEDLKNPAGVVTTLDTSTLQQDYLLAHTESDKSEYEEEEEQEEEEEERKFRKTSVKAVLVEDAVYLNLNMRVLKFTEILDDKDMRKVTSVRNENEYKEEKSVSDKGPNHTRNEEAADDKFAVDENGGSDKDSNPSLAEGGEELKALKDFKALISEKTEPKSIKTLSRAIIALLLLLVVLACVELSFRLKQANEFDSGLGSIVQAYQRHDLMASINFKIRQLNNIAFSIVTDTSGAIQADLKSDLITLIDNLSNIQFNIMKASEVISADGTDTFDSQTITLEHLQETGTVDLDYRIYTDAVFQYITAASALRSTTLSSLKNGPSDTSVKNFYFVVKNGLGPLRSGSEAEADNFYNYYIKKTNTYNTTFLVIMIVGIVVLVISELILIPIVFSVHKTNNRVLSLFGYIPEEEIDELVAKCKDYMENYLEEHREQRDYSFEGSEEDIEPSNRPENVESSYLEISQNQDAADGEAPDMSLQLDVSEKIKASPIPVKSEKVQDSLKVPMGSNSASARNVNKSPVMSANLSPNKSVTNMSSGQEPLVRHRSGVRDREEKNATKEEDRKKEDADLEAERAFNKSQKLLNSKDNRRSKVVFQFAGIAFLFLFYFLLDYLWIEKSFLSNIKMNLQHLKLSASRTSEIRYLNAFTLEEIAYADLTITKAYTFANQLGPNLRLYYNTLLQNNNKEITAPSNLNFAKTFDDYLATFDSYTNNDVCEIYYEPLNMTTQCDNLGSGFLNSGITLAITTIALNTNDVITNFYNEIAAKSPNTAAQLLAIQYKYANTLKLTTAQQGMDMLMPPLNSLMNSFGNNYESYLSTFKQGEIIKFVIYILFCIFVFVILWLPYRKNLSDKIFRTKGMLNMIPMEIITKNEGLKGLFLAGDILQGVK